MQPNVRHPAVAEEFYPNDAEALRETLRDLFGDLRPSSDGRVRAILAPHSAYRYGGTISAKAFGAVAGRKYRTVFLIGNAHAYLFDNIAIDTHSAWATPLGETPVDRKTGKLLTRIAPERFHELDIAHHCDHVLEVQLPFLQHVLAPGFSILPLLFGRNRHDIYLDAAESILRVMGKNDLIVASTDLSHYPSYRDAKTIDRMTMEHMAKLDIAALDAHECEVRKRNIPGAISSFCSPDAVRTLLEIGRRLGWKAGKPAYQNSGDSLHDDRLAVVGFGSLALYEA